MDKPSFEQLIREDRAARESKRWRGTFLEYLEMVRQNPGLPKLSHARALRHDDAGRHAGHPRLRRPTGEATLQGRVAQGLQLLPRRVLRHREDDRQIVRYFHSASLKGEESRQVLYLMGPVGSGKSSLVEKLQRGLERSRSPSTPSKAARCTRSRCISSPATCARSSRRCSGVHIEGDLCPVCRFRLKEEFGGRYEDFPVVTPRVLEAQPRRHRRRAARRPEQPGHLGADRQRGHLEARPLLRGRPARARPERRAQRRQPRHGRVHRGLQERDRVPPRHDHGDPGEGHPRARPPRHGLRRHRASSPTRTRRSGRSSRPTTPTRRSSTASSSSRCRTTCACPKR